MYIKLSEKKILLIVYLNKEIKKSLISKTSYSINYCMCIQCENKITRKLSEMNHLSNSRKINQPRFYIVAVSENRYSLKYFNNGKKSSVYN